MSFYYYATLAFFIGMMVPVQALLNAGLGERLGHPLWATATNFAVGLFSVAAFILFQRLPFPALPSVAGIAPVFWTGGVLGALMITLGLLAIPKLGAALTISIIIAGQMMVSLLCDHYGFLMEQTHSISFLRIIGGILIVSGIFLIKKF